MSADDVLQIVQTRIDKVERDLQVLNRVMETLIAAKSKLEELHAMIQSFEDLVSSGGNPTPGAIADVEAMRKEAESVEGSMKVLGAFAEAFIN